MAIEKLTQFYRSKADTSQRSRKKTGSSLDVEHTLSMQMNGEVPKEEKTRGKETETSKLIQKEKAESGNVQCIVVNNLQFVNCYWFFVG